MLVTMRFVCKRTLNKDGRKTLRYEPCPGTTSHSSSTLTFSSFPPPFSLSSLLNDAQLGGSTTKETVSVYTTQPPALPLGPDFPHKTTFFHFHFLPCLSRLSLSSFCLLVFLSLKSLKASRISSRNKPLRYAVHDHNTFRAGRSRPTCHSLYTVCLQHVCHKASNDMQWSPRGITAFSLSHEAGSHMLSSAL